MNNYFENDPILLIHLLPRQNDHQRRRTILDLDFTGNKENNSYTGKENNSYTGWLIRSGLD